MKLICADLFCGAGGTSTGIMEAGAEAGRVVHLTAVNHWTKAIETHSANHPEARHLCASLDSINPRELFGEDTLDILWASPECTHHSVARGGRPMNDQSRSTAWCVTRWAEALRPKVILVENVKEFREWGPIGSNGRPLESKKGDLFRAWVKTLEAAGYRVEWKVLCAADYGDPTTRRRLFVFAVRGRRKIIWPEATHSQAPELFRSKRWIPAREIIDWTNKGKSIYARKKPLAEKTMRRIMIGLQKFGLQPIILPHPRVKGDAAISTERPLPTVTATSSDFSLAEPFLVHLRGTSDAQIEGSARSVDSPAPALTAGGGHLGLINPYLVHVAHGNGKDANADERRAKDLNNPLPTVAGNRGEIALCEPFIVPQQQGGRPVHSVDEPVSTIATAGAHAICQPYIVPIDQQGSPDGVKSIDDPVSTIVTKQRHALAQPFLVNYYGAANAESINEPLDTVTANDRFGLCQPTIEIKGERYLIDILFRMLTPRELASAQGFPANYQFKGNSTEVVKQIGNAVPKNLAKALAAAAIEIL